MLETLGGPDRRVAMPLLGEDLQALPASRRDRLIVAALVGVAIVLRAPTLGRAYWIDEGISLGIASYPLRQISSLLAHHDGSPPLFYLLLHVWIKVFGTSEVATRFFPFLTALAIIPLAYWAGREIFDRRAGLAAAALFATNPLLNWYSTETRMYPLVVLFSLAGLACTVRAVRGRRPNDLVGAVACATALLYTHDWGLYLVAFTIAVLSARAWRSGDRQLLRGIVGCSAVIGVLFLPWLPSFLSQARHTAAPWAVPPQLRVIVIDPGGAIGGTLGPLVVPLLAFGVWVARRDGMERDRRVVRFLLVVSGITIGGAWLAAHLQPSWAPRYLAIVVAPLLLAAAGALSPTLRGRRIVAAACGLLVVWSIVGTLLPNPSSAYAKSNVAAVAHAAAPYLHPGDVVVVNQTEQLAVLSHYLPKGLVYVTPTGPVATPTYVDWHDIIARLNAADPCLTVAPTLAGLPPGAHVLEVSPLRRLGASGSAWYQAVNGQVRNVDYLLATDPGLSELHSLTEGTQPKPYSAVVGELFVKTGGPNTCQLPQAR